MMRSILRRWLEAWRQGVSREVDSGVCLLERLDARLLLSGTVYTVDSLEDTVADDGVVTLREAIEAANMNQAVFDALAGDEIEQDRIVFDPMLFVDGQATIVLDGEQLEITDSLLIEGFGEGGLVIDAAGESRVFQIENTTVEIFNLTITGGHVRDGGGIYAVDSTLALDNVVVVDNFAEEHGGGVFNVGSTLSITNSRIEKNNGNYGGGISSENATLEIMGSSIESNFSRRDGAGLYNLDSEIVISESLITKNDAVGDGAGIMNDDSSMSISNTVISSNDATWGNNPGSGGGVYLRNISDVTVYESLITENIGINGGGIINNNFGSSLTVSYSTISENHAKAGGGGIYNGSFGTVTVNHSILQGNYAYDREFGHTDGRGGAVFNRGTLAIDNSVISANYAWSDYAGGVYITDVGGSNVETRINNSSVIGNTGGGIHVFSGRDPKINNSIVAHNTRRDILGTHDGAHNIIGADPLIVRIPYHGGDGWYDDPLTPEVDESANNDYGDLRLTRESPAIDSGNNALVDASRIYGVNVDIGAYEYVLPGDANRDAVVDLVDLAVLASNFGDEVSQGYGLTDLSSKGDFSNDGVVDLIDLAILASHFGESFYPEQVTVEGISASGVDESLVGILEHKQSRDEELRWDHITSVFIV